MNNITGFNSEQIREAVKEIKNTKPDFALMLDLYEKIFTAQVESIESVKIPEFKIADDILSMKLSEKFPLVDIPQFVIDKEQSEALFKKICSFLTESSDELSETVKKIAQLAETKKIDLDAVFSSFIKEDESLFDSIEKEQNIDKAVLGFIVYNSIKPSLMLFSQKLSSYLDVEHEWDKGYCPVCGSAPELSMLEENGKRFMVCGFCSHKWISKRIYCPFCENSDHETLKYYEINKEEEYRVDVCEICKKYIKTIDTKKTSRTIYPPLESKSTTYIDLKFEELGYKPGNIKD